MFFSCFKYTGKTNYIDNILSKIEKIYNEYVALFNSMKNKVESWKIKYIEDRLVTLEFENVDFLRWQNHLEYNKKIPFIKKHIINCFAYYNDTIIYIKNYTLLDDELNTHLNNLFNLTMTAYQSISYFYTNEQLDEYDMYEDYKGFIKDQIQEFLDKLINDCKNEFDKLTGINQRHQMEFINYKNTMYPFILINFNIHDEYDKYFDNLCKNIYYFLKYRDKTITNIRLNHNQLSCDAPIFIKLSEKIFELSLSLLKNIVLAILFYTDISSRNIKLLNDDKIKQNNIEDAFEYGIMYNMLTGVSINSSFILELYNIIKNYMTYEVFKKHTPSEYLVGENKYNECKKYVLNIITINHKNIENIAGSQRFKSTLIYLYEFIFYHFKFNPEYINHSDVISEQETNINIENNDIIIETLLNTYTIDEKNEEIQLKGLSSVVKKGTKKVANYFFDALLDEVLQWIYDIPDKEVLKKYINLYNYMHLDNKFLPPHTVINQHTVCMPIDIINNLSIFDNKAVLFGDKNMDINSLINAYSLYANINDTDIAKSIFKERMWQQYLWCRCIKSMGLYCKRA